MANQQNQTQTQTQGGATHLNPSLQTVVKTNTEQLAETMKASHDMLAKNVDAATDAARNQISQASQAVLTNATDSTNFTKSQVDAVVAASTNMVEGVESLNHEFVDFSKAQLDRHVDATRKVFEVNSVNELFELQSRVARESMDGMLGQSAKMAEMAFKMASDVLQPLQTQATNAMDRAVTSKSAA